MKNKTLNQRLNDKGNENGEKTYEILNDFLTEKNQSIGFLSKFRILKKLFYKKQNNVQEEVYNNLENIFNKTYSIDFLKIFYLLSINNQTRMYMQENMQTVLKRILSTNSSQGIINNMQTVFNIVEEIYGKEFSEENKIAFVNNNIDTILDNIDKENMLEHVQSIIGISSKVDTKINKTIEYNKNAVVDGIIRKMKQEYVDVKELGPVIKEYDNFVSSIIEKCIKSEHVRWIDIKKVIKDSKHKDIYYIGSKVLRIGGVRHKKEIPNTTRLLQPIESYSLLSKGEPYATVEILDRVDRLEKSDLEGQGIYDGYGEDMYQLYKELRNSNIIWIDAPHSLGYRKGKEKIRENMMIIDSDSLYNLSDSEHLSKRKRSDLSMQFEIRWNSERNEKLAKLHRTTEVEKEENV